MGRGYWIADDINTLLKFDGQNSDDKLFVKEAGIRNRQVFMRVDRESVPQYTEPGFPIDYFLKEKPAKPLKLEILDSEGELVQAYVSDTSDTKTKDEVIEDMSLNTVTYIVDKKLNSGAGMHRFMWDMSTIGPWNDNKNRRFKNGPMVPPGKYKVRLIIGDKVLEEEFTLNPDPRLGKTNTTVDDIKKQYAFTLELIDLLNKARKLEAELKSELKKLENKEADNSQKLGIEAALEKLREKDITYPQPQLIDQMEYLYYMTNGADQMMGKDAYDQLEFLTNEFKKVKEGITIER